MKRSLLPLLFLALSCTSVEVVEDQPTTPPVLKENVFILAVDKGDADPSQDENLYYKIFINREPVAKTTSGLFFQKKEVKLKLEPGKYLFYAERWQLDKTTKDIPEYRRSNNIWQMSKPVYLEVPEYGRLEIRLGYDHNARSFYIETKAPGY